MGARETYDLVVVGAGPGGYVAGVRAAQLGMKVACVEKSAQPGGVCLNVGCIPSKVLLDSSEWYHLARNAMAGHGVLVHPVKLDLSAMMARKEKVVTELCESVRKLLQNNRVTLLHGTARLTGPDRVRITPDEAQMEPYEIEAGRILLATGSEPVSLPFLPMDGERVVSSTEALAFDSVPEHLVIVGGGYIGLELGSVWLRLGARVAVVEMTGRIAGALDGQVGRSLERSLARQGFQFMVNAKVTGVQVNGKSVGVHVERTGPSGGVEELQCDRLLVAVGRKPSVRDLGLEELGVRHVPGMSCLWVNERYETSVPGIFAIGDLVPGPMLAHKASAEGIAAVECMAGLPGEVNYDVIPSVVYTSPEVGSVGITEEQAKEQSISVNIGRYAFSGTGRAWSLGQTEGFVKMISHARSGRILGVHIIGPQASELIAECALAMEIGASVQDLARTVHAHPTLSEAVREAAITALVPRGANP